LTFQHVKKEFWPYIYFLPQQNHSGENGVVFNHALHLVEVENKFGLECAAITTTCTRIAKDSTRKHLIAIHKLVPQV